jgi:hypothetical protein
MTTFLLLSDSYGFVDVGRSLWREDGSVVYNCCCPLPAQSYFIASDARLPSSPQRQSRSQSYVTTDGQSASHSWNKASIWGLGPDLYYYQTVAGLLMWGSLSDERTSLSFDGVTVSNNKSVVSMYNLHFTFYLIYVYVQHIHRICQFRLSTAYHAIS